MAQIKRRTFVSGAVGAAGITSLGWCAGPARASGSEDVVLVSSGRPTVSLKWWGGEPAKFAAEELRDYLEAMTGVRVRVHPARLLGTAPDHALHGVVARPGAPATRCPRTGSPRRMPSWPTPAETPTPWWPRTTG